MHQRFAEASRVVNPPPPFDDLVEAARLAALQSYRVLDEADAAGLSRLAEQAAQALGGSQAAVSFVDAGRVWFAGGFGFAQSDVAREGSFCDAVVRSAGPLLVAHAQDDPRFWAHQLVHDGVRSYAGAPLTDEGGYRLGAVAVFAPTPDAFGRDTLGDLAALALMVRDFLAETRAAHRGRSGRVQGWLGVRTLAPQARTGVAGLIVLSVAKNSPAARAGLRPTDILHSIGSRQLHVPTDVTDALGDRDYGIWLPIWFRRAGVWHDAEIQVRPRMQPNWRG